MRTAAALAALVLMVGCGTWSWRLPGIRYAPRDAPAAVYPGLQGADLAPESYAIASGEVAGQNMDAVMAKMAADGRRRGADAVVMMDFETMTAHWSTFHLQDTEKPGEIARTETIETAETWATVAATAVRAPTWCLGLQLACEDVDGACSSRIDRIAIGSPAEAAGLRLGNRIASVDGLPVAHPWDVHQRVDAAGGSAVNLGIQGPNSTISVVVEPVGCGALYGGSDDSSPDSGD
ncbi:MAG: hypothetical protein GY898_32920 [Proteobacteria bacterium]|nr:hypothetical protein [Pseudomonadota bacterium]